MPRTGMAVLLFVCATTFAFDAPIDRQGAFSAEIHIASRVQVNGTPIPASVEIRSEANRPLPATIHLQGIDGWQVEPSRQGGKERGETATFTSEIVPHQPGVFPFTVIPATDSLVALYPIHAEVTVLTGTTEVQLHPVALLEVTQVAAPQIKPAHPLVAEVSPEIPFFLTSSPNATLEVRPDGSAQRSLPPGWTGVDPETGAMLQEVPAIRRGGKTLPAWGIHPPYKKAPGSARLTWKIRLPEITPISFGAEVAIRDIHEGEPESDGVTYRVWAENQLLFEKHSISKSWQEVRADLSAFAGREIELSLESDVGPQRNSVCDQSYWGRPWIYAGQLPAVTETPSEKRMDIAKTQLAEVLASQTEPLSDPSARYIKDTGVYLFGDHRTTHGAAFVPGRLGILDAAFAIGTRDSMVACVGFEIGLEGVDPTEFLSGFQLADSTREGNLYRTILTRAGQPHWVTLEIVPAEEGLRLDWDSDLQLTDLSNGPFDRLAEEIFLGVGNVIRGLAKPFTLHADGHRLATRHVGLTFDNGLSLVVACSNPPDRFSANPKTREYSLHSHIAGSFFLVPSQEGAFDAALGYRRMARFPKGPGVEELAGRFTFDLWGGTYAETAGDLKQAARYGLTDSVVVFHNWQRWGYDYRLPDIYPPNPNLGTLEEFRNLRRVCRENGISFAPHDNYIDFYPDAEGFSYDHVCFDSSGNPIKGWLNFGRDAQAYRFRPDSIGLFLEKNLRKIQESFEPDAYFVDVFSSIGAFDYWSREGRFQSAKETIEQWNAGFDRIREILGGTALQISESGNDWLVGHLDGAQCNHLRIAPEESAFSWQVDCEDHERIPWQDAVMHDAFVLQGVGYPNRYCSGQDPYLHGIDSDDYLCDEVLTGHAPMTSAAFGRATVRKYYLLHDFLAEIAAIPMTAIECVEGDIHRQKVTYANGAQVWANRSSQDWTLEKDLTLPPYGFWAAGPKTQSGIIKRGDRILELSHGPGVFYADGRHIDCQGLVPLAVSLVDFQPVEERGREYRMVLEWKTLGELPKGYQPYVAFTVPGPYGFDKTLFMAQGPWPDLSDLTESIFRQEVKVILPESLEVTSLAIHSGIYSPAEKNRRMILGTRNTFGVVVLGNLQIDPKTARASAIPATPEAPIALPDLSDPADFGWCRTAVGVRAEVRGTEVRVTPLPEGVPAPFTLHLPSFALQGEVTVDAESMEGVRHRVETSREGDLLRWDLDPEVFCYHIEKAP